MDKIIYNEHLSEPWFTLVLLGLKTVEGRLYKNRFTTYKVGDVVKWYNNDFTGNNKQNECIGQICENKSLKNSANSEYDRSVFTEITKITMYSTFKEYLECEGLQNCLTGMSDIEHGLNVYYKYYTKEDERTYGIVAFTLKKIN